MKKKYISPKIQTILIGFESCLLAGSNGDPAVIFNNEAPVVGDGTDMNSNRNGRLWEEDWL